MCVYDFPWSPPWWESPSTALCFEALPSNSRPKQGGRRAARLRQPLPPPLPHVGGAGGAHVLQPAERPDVDPGHLHAGLHAGAQGEAQPGSYSSERQLAYLALRCAASSMCVCLYHTTGSASGARGLHARPSPRPLGRLRCRASDPLANAALLGDSLPQVSGIGSTRHALLCWVIPLENLAVAWCILRLPGDYAR